MGKSQRDKGARLEREFAKHIQGVRIPLSGAAGGKFANDVEGMGLKWEVKGRKDGFKQLYGWLEGEGKPNALAIKADRKEWLVVIPLSTFKELMGGHQQ
jgi:Holliday junction resolvase